MNYMRLAIIDGGWDAGAGSTLPTDAGYLGGIFVCVLVLIAVIIVGTYLDKQNKPK